MTPVIELDGIERTFAADPPVHALRNVRLRVEKGEYLSIVGPSGSGKSTLLTTLGLLDRPDKGSYRLDGIETTELDDARRTALRGSRIGFVFQAFHLLAHRSAVDNVGLAELYQKGERRGRTQRAEVALQRVGLGHRTLFRPDRLSGGERQRVAIARALVGEPSLLLCDEPTGNLDRAAADTVADLLLQLHAARQTILIVVTHSAALAAKFPVRYEMNAGTLIRA
jgi:putative ABC transport system ATP-binding protein